jgi:hypothetical protein
LLPRVGPPIFELLTGLLVDCVVDWYRLPRNRYGHELKYRETEQWLS